MKLPRQRLAITRWFGNPREVYGGVDLPLRHPWIGDSRCGLASRRKLRKS